MYIWKLHEHLFIFTALHAALSHKSRFSLDLGGINKHSEGTYAFVASQLALVQAPKQPCC